MTCGRAGEAGIRLNASDEQKILELPRRFHEVAPVSIEEMGDRRTPPSTAPRTTAFLAGR